MQKKHSAVLLAVALLVMLMGGCQGGVARSIGMVTASGSLEDNAFNQSAWEGMTQAEQQFDVEIKHYKPETEDEAGYLAGIKALRTSGCRVIVCTGEGFKSSLEAAQTAYRDCQFIAVDFVPDEVADNTVSVLFAEQEASFVAGVAVSLQLKEGRAGGVLGEQSEPVDRFLKGFLQGVRYANKEFGTNVSANESDFPYINSFTDEALAQKTAARLYDDGVDVIFTVAGGAGQGAISEAKNRALAGKPAWIVGVDVDQYALGVYNEEGDSVVLTSAVKQIGTAVFSVIEAERRGEFPGGQMLMLDAKNDGVGIPATNPNLSEDVQKTAAIILNQIKNGEIVVDL